MIIKYTISISPPPLCISCNRRQMYARCSVCSTAQCALCSWTVVGQLIIAEVCRRCMDKA